MGQTPLVGRSGSKRVSGVGGGGEADGRLPGVLPHMPMAMTYPAAPLARTVFPKCSSRWALSVVTIHCRRGDCRLRRFTNCLCRISQASCQSASPIGERSRRKPKRCNHPVPGDRVQMDTCKIHRGFYQVTAVDDRSHFLVAGLARCRSADAILDQYGFWWIGASRERVRGDPGAERSAKAMKLVEKTKGESGMRERMYPV